MKPGQSDDFFDDEEPDDVDEEAEDSDETVADISQTTSGDQNDTESRATPIVDKSEGSESHETASDMDRKTGDVRDIETPSAAASGESTAVESLPYIFDRDGVKDERDRVQFFLREEFQGLDRDVRRAAEEEFGVDVPLTDVREAMVRAAAEHPERVIGILRDDGYRLRE